jgi:hypothetical protein
VVDLLLVIHSLQELVAHTCIDPLDVPDFTLAKILYTPIKAFGAADFLQNRIFSV